MPWVSWSSLLNSGPHRRDVDDMGARLTLSVILAVPIGLALGANDVIYRSSRFTIDFFRTIPPVALVPLLLLVFGATGQMVVTLIVIAAVWPLLLQSMYGVHQVDSVARDVARSYRLRWSDRSCD